MQIIIHPRRYPELDPAHEISVNLMRAAARHTEREILEHIMPVTVRKQGSKFRVVESNSGRIAKSKSGKPRDAGGHNSREKAQRQARAINANR